MCVWLFILNNKVKEIMHGENNIFKLYSLLHQS